MKKLFYSVIFLILAAVAFALTIKFMSAQTITDRFIAEARKNFEQVAPESATLGEFDFTKTPYSNTATDTKMLGEVNNHWNYHTFISSFLYNTGLAQKEIGAKSFTSNFEYPSTTKFVCDLSWVDEQKRHLAVHMELNWNQSTNKPTDIAMEQKLESTVVQKSKVSNFQVKKATIYEKYAYGYSQKQSGVKEFRYFYNVPTLLYSVSNKDEIKNTTTSGQDFVLMFYPDFVRDVKFPKTSEYNPFPS